MWFKNRYKITKKTDLHIILGRSVEYPTLFRAFNKFHIYCTAYYYY